MKHLLAFLSAACLIAVLLISSIGLVVFSKGFYTDFYARENLAAQENLRSEDVESAIFLMVDYVQGTRDDLEGTIVWKGKEQPTFNEKEKAHMVDVRALWQRAWQVLWAALAISLVSAAFLYRLVGRHTLSWLAKGYLEALSCLAVGLVFFGFWMAIDFGGLWIQFHHWFFTNDLWSLNPATDFMIVICPESLFFTMIIRISLCFALPVVLLALFSLYYLRRKAVIGFERLNAPTERKRSRP